LIFVCVGSREYQFNRLLKALDDLVSRGMVPEEIIAQIGQSEYEPKNYKWYRYIDRDDFKNYQSQAHLIISHAGTGALIGALKLEKQVISVPRLAKYGEHIDDHQTQISGVLAGEGYLREVLDMDMLGDAIQMAYQKPIVKKFNKPSRIVDIIEDFLIQG